MDYRKLNFLNKEGLPHIYLQTYSEILKGEINISSLRELCIELKKLELRKGILPYFLLFFQNSISKE